MTVESALGFAMAMFILAITPGPGVFASVSQVILFYAGFLPTFMDLSILKPIDVSIVSGLVVLILSGIMAMYSFSASRARKLFTSYRALRNLNRSAGTVMIGTGLMIATR